MSITRSSPVQVAAFSTTFSQAPKLVSTSWSKISVGPSHVLAIRSNNTLYAWGFNNVGQLGDGTTISRSSPVQIGNPSIYTWTDIVAGLNFSVGLRGDNLLFTWGLNTNGQLGDLNAGTSNRSSPIQVGTSSWNAVSAGGSHVVAIRSDKSLWAWGLNSLGQLGTNDLSTRSSPVQVSSSSWSIVSAGNTHTTAITTDGKLYTWGDNTVGTLGYTIPPQTYYSWTSVAGNADYTVAIRNDGLLFAWGTNNFGQLGDFTTINRSSPVQIGSSSWSIVSANAPTGGGPVLAIRSDGTLWGWGYNATGALGINDVANRSSPVQVSGGGSWSAVSASKSHTLAIKSTDGLLYAWGLNTSGQLGTFDAISRSSPVQVSGSATASFLTFNSATAVDNSGNNVTLTVASGSPTIGNSVIPFSNTYSANFTSNAYYQASFPALGTQWTFEFWVYVTTVPPGNWYWYIGSGQGPLFYFVGNSTSITSLGKVNQGGGANFSGAASLAANTWAHIAYTRNASNLITIWFNGTSVATTTDGTGFGGSSSQFGYPAGGNGGSAAGYISNFRFINNYCAYTAAFTRPTTASPATISFYGTITPANRVTAISAGDTSSYVIKNDNQLYTWGAGTDGRLGLTDTVSRSSPVQISSKSWTSVFAYGSSFVHAIDSFNKLFAWGLGTTGQLGYNDAVSRSSPVQISSGNFSTIGAYGTTPNTLAIQTDGSLWAWGSKTNLLLGEFSNASYTYSWSQVSAGPSHTGAIRSDGRLYTWGFNTSGQLGNSSTVGTSSPTLITTIPDVSSEFWNRVAVNQLRTIAIRNDGTLWTWGSNAGYLLGTGDSINRSKPIQIGNSITTEVSNSNIYSTFFNGTSDYISTVTTPANLGTSDFTVEGWFYFNTNTNGYKPIIASAGTVDQQGWILITETANQLALYFSNGSAWTYNYVSTYIPPINVWTHLAIVRLTTTITLYANGIALGTTVTPIGANSVSVGSTAFYVGYYPYFPGGARFFSGYISNFRITKGVGVYTGNFTVPTAPLTATQSAGTNIAAVTGTQTSLLTLQNLTIIDNAVSPFTITAIGDPYPGQQITPFPSFISAIRSWTGLTAGTSHTVAINNLGRMYVWGDNTYQQLGLGSTVTLRSQPVQVGTSSWSQVSSYGNHNLAIDTNNKLYSWGDNTLGQVGVSSSPLQWTTVNSYYTAQMIRNDGIVYAMGLNNGGQIGDSSIVSRSSPVQLSGGGSWTQLVSGYDGTNFGYTLGIKTDGTLYAWGLNSSGILGDSTLATTVTRSSPVQVGTSSWLIVSTMNNSAIAIRSDYTMWAWGKNASGQLGDGTTVDKSSPIQIGTSSWTQVSVGVSSAIAIRLDGALFTWGLNTSGQLGDITVVTKSSPVQIGVSSYIQISGTSSSKYAIRNDYTLWSWGFNTNGELGLTDVAPRSSPVQVNVGFNYDSISSGADHVVAKRRDGTLWAWGLNTAGQVGDITIVSRSSPVQVGTSSWISVSAGFKNTFGITVSAINGLQNLYAWGYNVNGEFGLGDTAYRSSPVQIGSGQQLQSVSSPTQIGTSSWTSISASLNNSMAIRSDYKLFTWGDNSQLQSGYITPATVLSTSNKTNNDAQSFIRSTDNALIIWGANDAGQLGDGSITNKSNPVQLGVGFGNSRFAKIARAKVASAGYTLGIKTDGTLWSWGSGVGGVLGSTATTNRSSPVQVGTLTTWSDVAAGPSHALAIKSDGSLWGWGLNTNGQAGVLSWSKVSSGSSHTLAIRSDGALYGWGSNTVGQVGDISIITRSSPVQLGSSSFIQVVAGINISAAIRSDSTLWAWGLNSSGALGLGDTANRSSPVQVGLSSWSQISTRDYMAGITYDNRLFTWGSNAGYQLGDGTTNPRSSPVQVGSSSYTSVSAGGSYMAAIRIDSGLFIWGTNTTGQLGLNDVALRSQPTQIGSSSWNVVSASNNAHTLALTTDNKLYAWGNNFFSQLGLNDTVNRSSPVQVGSSSWTNVYAGTNYSIALRTDNTVFAWGSGIQGQLGIYTPLSWTLGNSTFTHANDFTLWAWGDNTYGQLGISSTQSRSSPVQIGTTSWTYTYSTTSNAYAIKSDGTMWAWGRNYFGQLGLSDTTDRSSPVQIGTDTNWSTVVASATGHALAIKTTGTLWGWGYNQYNELGQNQLVQTNRSAPVQVGSATTWTKVSAGNNYSLGISAFGLWAWGRNDWGQTGNPNNTPLSWTSVAGGDSYSVAIRSDGKLFSWGLNNKGQLGLGHTVNKSTPAQIAISTNYNLYSTSFNGSTDYLQVTYGVGLNLVSTSFTIEFWVWSNTTNSTTGQIIVKDGIASTNVPAYAVYLTTGPALVFLVGNSTTSSSTTQLISTIQFPLNQWVHVAVTLSASGGTMSLYQNGVLVATTATSVAIVDSARPLYIGYHQSQPATNFFSGYISNLRIIKGQVLYTANFIPSITPLTTTSQGATAGNVTLLTLQNDRYVDNSSSNFAFTPTGATLAISTFAPFQTTAYNYSFTQVSATLSHVLAVRNDGGLFAWGANDGGQLGQGDTALRSAPIQIGSSSWTKVAAGSNNSFAIRSDGALFGWGDNTNGILGQSNTTSLSSPIIINLGTSWTNISATQHILGTTNLGEMYAWGLNNAGQLGTTNINAAGDVQSRSVPIQIGSPNSWNLVAAGASFSMATGSTGLLYTWGLGTSGQLGGTGGGTTTASNNTSRSSPSQIGASSWSAIASGTSWAAGISQATAGAGRLFLWGGSVNYEAGVGNTLLRSSPVQLGALSWTAIGGTSNPIGIQNITGSLFAWGTQSAGQLGQNDVALRSSPVQIASLSGLVLDNLSSPTQIGASSWTQLSAGDAHGMALRIDSGLFTWGKADYGQLGSGNNTNRSSPVQVGSSSWSQISAGNSTSAAITTLGSLQTWGRNNVGQLGASTTTDRNAPAALGTSSWSIVSASKDTMFAVTIFNQLFAWGNNAQGQFGDSTTVNRSSPVQVGSNIQTLFSNPTQIGASVLPNSNSVYFNGSNDYLTFASNAAFALGTGNFTIECWFYRINTGVNQAIFDTRSPVDTANIGYNIYIDNATSSINFGTSGTDYVNGPTSGVVSNSWNHVAVVRESLTVIKMYLNGVQHSTTFTASATQNFTNNTPRIGNGVQGLFTGYISNLRVVSGSALYTATFTPSTTALTAISGTVLLTCQSSTFIDNSVANSGVGFPVQVAGAPIILGASYTQISAGESNSTFVATNGVLFNVGNATTGQIGDSTTVNKSFLQVVANPTLYDNRSSPAQIGTGSWSQIAVGLNYSIALASDGTLYTWGDNTAGYLGNGTTLTRRSMTQIGTSSYTSISSGGSHTVALKLDKTLYAWGLNNAGQLGDNSVLSRSSPVQVNTGLATSWNFISAGASHTGALDATYNLPYGWGLNSSGQLGDTTVVSRSAPVQVNTASLQNYSYQFNGSNQYLTSAASASNQLTSNFTIEFWFYAIALNGGSGSGLVAINDAVGPNSSTGLSIFLDTGGILTYFVNGNGGGVAGPTIVISTWYHVALVRSGSTNTLYLNGVSRATSSTTPAWSATPSIGIGRIYNDNASFVHNGYISNVRIVKGTALYTSGFYPSTGSLTTASQGATPSQVLLLTAQSATIVDNSINLTTFTNTGTVASSTSNPFGPYYSGNFSGSNYLSVTNNSSIDLATGAPNWTIECWFYTTTSGNQRAIIQKDGISGSRQSQYGISISTGNQINLTLSTAVGGGGNQNFVGGSISASTWYHVAAVRSGSNITVFLNGAIIAGPTALSTTLGNNTGDLTIGMNTGPADFFTGYISNLRIVKGTAVYTGSFTPPTNILRTAQSAMTNMVALTGTETILLTLQNATVIDNSATPLTITNNNSVGMTTLFAPFSASGVIVYTAWDSIQAGVTSTMGISNNTLYTWGAGTNGQLGNNTVTGISAPAATGTASIWSVAEKLFSSPVQVGTAYSWSLVSAGAGHTVAMATDYSLWAWGQNTAGQTGDSTTVGKSSPTQIAGNTSSYTFITAGVSDTFAIRTTTNLLFAWGLNTAGQLGLNDTANRSSPVQVFAGTMTSPLIPIRLNTVSGSSYTVVQAGSAASVIDSLGRLFTWGTNTNGQLGDNTTTNRSSPVQLGGLTGFIYSFSPIQVGSSSYSQVSAGYSHTLAIGITGSLYAWGKTPANGATVTRSSPVQIGSNSWLFVSAGIDASQAIDSTRTLYAWGLNTNYQLGSASFLLNQSVTSPVAIGTLAINTASHTNSVGSGNGGFIKNI
jgi:alpha-tubulin suppressor-like RCC1 family protein